MTPLRRRPVVALAAPVVATLVALAPLAAALLPATAAAAAAGSSAPIQLRLTSLEPLAPQPGDTLVLTGDLTNVSSAPIADLALSLEISPAVVARSDFDAYAADPDGPLLGEQLATGPTPAQLTTLAAGASEHFSISLTLDTATRDRLGLLSGWQVNKLGIAVSGTTSLGTSTVGQLRTFLPWAPRNGIDRGSPTPVAWVWPLVDRPHRSASGTWFTDSLAPEISAGGRLAGLLNAASNAEDQSPLGHKPRTVNVPVTWAIDPMLVGDVASMAAGYRVRGANNTTSAGVGTSAAKQWLASLKTAVTRTDASVLPLPYADPDIVAVARTGGFATTIGVATTRGQQLLQKDLGTQSLLSYGWPVDGLTNQRGISLMTATGDTAMVLSDTNLPISGVAPAATPSAHAIITTDEGPVQALLSDSVLDADVTDGVGNPDGPRLSLQNFLAETLMIQRQAPSQPRDLVVAPDRRWDPTPTYAASLVADTGKVPWIEPVSLDSVLDSPITQVDRDPLTYPAQARRSELSPVYLELVASARKQVADFAAILPQGTPQIAGYNTALEQALSSAWRNKPRLGQDELDALRNTVTGETSQVRITSAPNSHVTLTSHGGKVPVTVANHLDVPVSVIVSVQKNQRLTLRDNKVVRVIPAHQQVAVDLHASAKTSGVFPLTIQLLTPNGQKLGSSVQLYVRSTVYGTITLVITGAATAALMVAVAIRLTRRAMAARHSTADAAT